MDRAAEAPHRSRARRASCIHGTVLRAGGPPGIARMLNLGMHSLPVPHTLSTPRTPLQKAMQASPAATRRTVAETIAHMAHMQEPHVCLPLTTHSLDTMCHFISAYLTYLGAMVPLLVSVEASCPRVLYRPCERAAPRSASRACGAAARCGATSRGRWRPSWTRRATWRCRARSCGPRRRRRTSRPPWKASCKSSRRRAAAALSSARRGSVLHAFETQRNTCLEQLLCVLCLRRALHVLRFCGAAMLTWCARELRVPCRWRSATQRWRDCMRS